MTDALIYLLDNIYIRFGSKLYRQNVGIPMGTNCAPLLLICFFSAMRGVYISQLIRFARASSHVTDFNNRNKFLTGKLLKQGYRYHKLHKAFSKFYRRHFELIEKYHVSLKKLMQQGICNPEFYGDLVYKFKKIIGNLNFSNLLKRIVNRFKRAGYSLDIMWQTACLVFNPIMVEGYAALFSCTAVVQASDSMTASM